jgi:hypothetical protein
VVKAYMVGSMVSSSIAPNMASVHSSPGGTMRSNKLTETTHVHRPWDLPHKDDPVDQYVVGEPPRVPRG